MKQVPFKCKFGHITIANGMFSIVECKECKEESTNKMMQYEHPYNDREYKHKWPSKKLLAKYKPEMARRV